MADGTASSEIAVFVRSRTELSRARAAILAAGGQPLQLSEREEATTGRIAAGTMHLAKGLEFKAVVVMACDDDVLPLRARLEAVADEVELDEVYETERPPALCRMHQGARPLVRERRQSCVGVLRRYARLIQATSNSSATSRRLTRNCGRNRTVWSGPPGWG